MEVSLGGEIKVGDKRRARVRGGSSVSGAIQQAVLSSPSVRLVDSLAMTCTTSLGHDTSGTLVGPYKSDYSSPERYPDGFVSSILAKHSDLTLFADNLESSAKCSSDGLCVPLLEVTCLAPTMSPEASESSAEHSSSTSPEGCASRVPVGGCNIPMVHVASRCHNLKGSCCPCHCRCNNARESPYGMNDRIIWI